MIYLADDPEFTRYFAYGDTLVKFVPVARDGLRVEVFDPKTNAFYSDSTFHSLILRDRDNMARSLNFEEFKVKMGQQIIEARPVFLYEHLALHAGPKSTVYYVKGYLVARSEDAVFTYLNRLNCWDDDYEPGYEEGLKKSRGPMFAEEDFGDAYYGIHREGWSVGKPIGHRDAATLIRLELAKQIDDDGKVIEGGKLS